MDIEMGPPYGSPYAALGGRPTRKVDIPICSVFLALFIIGAVSHMTIFITNKKRGHKFIMSGMMFGFCMARITTQVMRIVWACYPENLRVAIAAQIFVAAGVVLLFVINLIFTQRITRGAHPNGGWHPFFHWFYLAIYILIVLTLIMLITAVIQSFYTLNGNTRRIDRDIQLYGGTFYAIIAFLPIPIVILTLIVPRKTRVEKFGSGRWRTKVAILLTAAFLLCLGAAFRVGVNFAGGKRLRTNPANYQDKACFYIFNFTVEIIVVLLYVVVRVDRRFHVPDGSHGKGDYTRESKFAGEIRPEEEVFDDAPEEQPAQAQAQPQTQVGGNTAVARTDRDIEKAAI